MSEVGMTDYELAACHSFDEVARIACERAFPGQAPAIGTDRLLFKILDLDGCVAHFDRLTASAGINIEDGEKVKAIGVKQYLLSASRRHGKTSVNLVGPRFSVLAGGKPGDVKIVDGSGNVIEEVPAGGGVVIMDAASDFWDDLAECFTKCKELALKGLEKWLTYFRLSTIVSVCVLEAYLNKLAINYVNATATPDADILAEVRGDPNAKRIPLRDKIRKWPKKFAAKGSPKEGSIWDDGLINEVEGLILIRDNFVHNKRPARAFPNGLMALPGIIAFAKTVHAAVGRISKAVGDDPAWIRRNQDLYELPAYEKQNMGTSNEPPTD